MIHPHQIGGDHLEGEGLVDLAELSRAITRDQSERFASHPLLIDYYRDPSVDRSQANRTLAGRKGCETTRHGRDAGGPALHCLSPQPTIRRGHESSLELFQSSKFGVKFVSGHAVLESRARAREGKRESRQLAHTRRERAS